MQRIFFPVAIVFLEFRAWGQAKRTAAKATGGGGGGLNAFYWFQIFALKSAVVEAQK